MFSSSPNFLNWVPPDGGFGEVAIALFHPTSLFAGHLKGKNESVKVKIFKNKLKYLRWKHAGVDRKRKFLKIIVF